LPEEIFENCAALGQLNLSDNTLTGPLPEALAMLSELRQLHLGTNQFTGMLPVDLLLALGKPGNLRLLDLSNNALVVNAFEANLLTNGLPAGCELRLDPPDAEPDAKLPPRKPAEEKVDAFLDGLDNLPQAPLAKANQASAGEWKEAEANAEASPGEGKESAEAWNGGDWAEGWDEDSGAQYWYSEATGETVWEDPNAGL
jgi:hypothetical protein